MSEKTEQPTPKRLRESREKGQVAHSKEAVSAAMIIAVFGYFWATWDGYVAGLKELVLLPVDLYGLPFADAAKRLFDLLLVKCAQLVLPVLGLAVAVAILANFAQVGVLLAFESIKPDLKKINPAQGIKKIFSVKNVVEALKSILKIGFLSILLYRVIKDGLGDLLRIPYHDLASLSGLLAALMKQTALYSAMAFIAIAAADYAFQRFQHLKELKMSKDEVKREYKEMEGDPHIKSKRKQLHHQLVMGGIEQQVKKATVVVTNPTHVAVALYYEPGKTPLPVIKAKGENLIARRIKEIAQREGIPIMENVPLARGLLAQGEVDQYIPSELIGAVAEVLRWVQSLERP